MKLILTSNSKSNTHIGHSPLGLLKIDLAEGGKMITQEQLLILFSTIKDDILQWRRSTNIKDSVIEDDIMQAIKDDIRYTLEQKFNMTIRDDIMLKTLEEEIIMQLQKHTKNELTSEVIDVILKTIQDDIMQKSEYVIEDEIMNKTQAMAA
jgi:hypothetical protein